MHHTVIVGGGAAGMMTMAQLCESGYTGRITLFEKNKRLGTKVLISGGGRCNVTTGVRNKRVLLSKYMRGKEFLAHAAIKQCSPKKLYKWFESHDVPLKIENDLRVFPVSDDGSDIVGVFERIAQKHQVNVCYSQAVENISIQEGHETHTQTPNPTPNACPRQKKFLITTNKSMYQADAVVLTTGGNAYRHTGSTGDGYDFAQKLGHTITPLGPSLNSFAVKEKRIHHLSGIVLPDASLQPSENSTHTAIGGVLLTHFGLSGPGTFVFASQHPYTEITSDNSLTIRLCLNHNCDIHRWNQQLQSDFDVHPKKELKTILSQYFPQRLVEAILVQHDFTPWSQAAHINKTDRLQIASLLGKGIELTLTKRMPGDEFVTAGGVSLKQVDPHTGQSLICPDLYFAGEILDIDGVTGGFNLHSSRAMGYLVAQHIYTHTTLSSS